MGIEEVGRSTNCSSKYLYDRCCCWQQNRIQSPYFPSTDEHYKCDTSFFAALRFRDRDGHTIVGERKKKMLIHKKVCHVVLLQRTVVGAAVYKESRSRLGVLLLLQMLYISSFLFFSFRLKKRAQGDLLAAPSINTGSLLKCPRELGMFRQWENLR